MDILSNILEIFNVYSSLENILSNRGVGLFYMLTQ
jgi:hypothetical protein